MRHHYRGDYVIGYLAETNQKSRQRTHLAENSNFAERHPTIQNLGE
jgi:hypothetical protein